MTLVKFTVGLKTKIHLNLIPLLALYKCGQPAMLRVCNYSELNTGPPLSNMLVLWSDWKHLQNFYSNKEPQSSIKSTTVILSFPIPMASMTPVCLLTPNLRTCKNHPLSLGKSKMARGQEAYANMAMFFLLSTFTPAIRSQSMQYPVRN